jgi:hypothetical protein
MDVEPEMPPGTTSQVRSAAILADLRSVNSFTLSYFKEVQQFILIHFRVGVYLQKSVN